LDLSKDDISEMLALAKKQQEEQFGGRELPTRHLEEDDASKLITVQYADNWQENLMLQAVKVAREFSADAVKYPKLLLADEMDTVIADNNNKVVNNGEKPAQARFPLKVKFTPWTKERFLQCRKFDLEYSKDWDEELDEETAVFAKDNDAKREQFTLSVFDKQGNRLEPKEKPAKNRFPLLVKMIPVGPAKKTEEGHQLLASWRLERKGEPDNEVLYGRVECQMGRGWHRGDRQNRENRGAERFS